MPLEIVVEEIPDPEHVRDLVASLAAFNRTRVGDSNHRPIAVFVRDGEQALGGASGYTHWHWLFVSDVWIDESLRSRGTGRALMAAIEEAARGRGCRAAWLYTYSFQSLGFYESIGYRQFGELPDYPPSHTRYYLWRLLDPPISN